ncbi:MAG TPA: glycoside hydrolase family 3 N-terminal domain-containing protein, partial [Cyclobacteriaceae bacterium]|nr:glycoside hydrolase family 3 N-terminal domain-containing protein [Cyclobacteriaceae bacterium]
MSKKVFLSMLLFFTVSFIFAQDKKIQWVDSVFQTLTPEGKIGQLFMLPVSATSHHAADAMFDQINDHHIGGILITGGGPVASAKLINKLQQQSKVPLLVGVNAEWGLSQTMDSTISFPKPLMLGAIRNDSMVYQLGVEIARQMKVLGIHINFAQETYAKFNRENWEEVLLHYSDDKSMAASKSMAMVRGLQNHGIIVTAKQNDWKLSSRDTALVMNPALLAEFDFAPYSSMVNNGLNAMLTTNLNFSVLEKKEIIPAPLSELFISGVLKQKYGFTGLLFTNMASLQKSIEENKSGETEALAFVAGHDIIVSPENINQASKTILKA